MLLSLALVLALAEPVAVKADNDEIVVRGVRGVTERSRAQRFLAATGVAAGMQPAARWIQPVCPAVRGLEEAQQARVLARLRSHAKAAGVPLAREGCRANALVLFTGDARKVVKEIDRGGTLVQQAPPETRAWLREGSAPIRWFYASEVESADGGPSMDVPQPGLGMEDKDGNGIPVFSWGSSMPQRSLGIVSTKARRALIGATVVVEVGPALKASLESIADYAALVALAEVKAEPQPIDGSILGLFAAPERNIALSEGDLTFLKALYRVPLDRRARQHRRSIVQAMVDQAEVSADREPTP